MTKILATDNFGHQMIFSTYTDAAAHFECRTTKIKQNIDKCMPIRDSRSTWWLDELLEGK